MTTLFRILMNEYFLATFFFALTFLFLIPQTYKYSLRWNKTKKNKNFASTVIAGWAIVCILIPSFLLFLRDMNNMHFSIPIEYWRLLNILLIALSYLCLSKAALSFERVKTKKKTIDFVLMTFFGTISIYFLSVSSISFIQTVTRSCAHYR